MKTGLAHEQALEVVVADLEETKRQFPETEDVCELCDGARFVNGPTDRADPGFGEPVPCTCAGDTTDWRLSWANFPRGMAEEMTFDAFRPGQHRAALATMQGWSNESIVLSGPPGTGKTHLAIAALVARIKAGGRGRFVYVPEMLDDVRRRYNPDHAEDAQQYLDRIMAVPLLVLDDLGAERGTEWAVERLGMLIDHRYRSRMPTVVTTNYRDLGTVEAELGARNASRLSAWTWVAVGGEDHRGRRGATADQPEVSDA